LSSKNQLLMPDPHGLAPPRTDGGQRNEEKSGRTKSAQEAKSLAARDERAQHNSDQTGHKRKMLLEDVQRRSEQDSTGTKTWQKSKIIPAAKRNTTSEKQEQKSQKKIAQNRI
jgi:hypothetical protein